MRTVNRTIRLLMAMICLCTIAGAVSSSTDEVEWLDAEEHTLYWGDEVNNSGYLIQAVDFSPSKPSDVDNDYVVLSILTNRSESWSTILALNNSDISDHKNFEDRINISLVEIVTGNDIPAPYATISVSLSKENVHDIPVVKWIDATLSIEERRTHEIYMDERAYFDIEIKNRGNEVLESVEIVQEIPEEFVFDPDVRINWNFSLGAYEQRTCKYSLKALKPGTYDLSGLQVFVNHLGRIHSKTLNSSELIVHGPFINLSKSVSSDVVSPGDEVIVNVNVSNEGDRAAHVSITDELPQGAFLMNGDMSISRVMHPGDNLSMEYSMRVDIEGTTDVPSAKARFIDSKEYEGIVFSKRSVLNVGEYPVDPGMDSDEYDPELMEHRPDAFDGLENGDVSGYEAEGQVSVEAANEEDHGILQPVYDLIAYIKGFFSGT